jgi:hypothetical protein
LFLKYEGISKTTLGAGISAFGSLQDKVGNLNADEL